MIDRGTKRPAAMFWFWEVLVLVPVAFMFAMDDPTVPGVVTLAYIGWRVFCRFPNAGAD